LWSNLVIAVKLSFGIPLANVDAIKAFVFAGLPTTKTLTVLLALSPKALPYSIKILAFSFNKSALSIPGPLGLAPTNKAWSRSLKPVAKLSVTVTPANVGKAQSYNSIATA